MDALRDTLRLLPTLSQAELKQVAVHLSALTTKEQVEMADGAEPLYLEYTRIKKAQGQEVPHLGLLKKSRPKDYARLQAGVAVVEEFITRFGLKKIQRWKFLQFLAELCCEWVKNRGRPLTLYQFCYALSIIEELIDNAFPGYSEAGLLGAIVQGEIPDDT